MYLFIGLKRCIFSGSRKVVRKSFLQFDPEIIFVAVLDRMRLT